MKRGEVEAIFLVSVRKGDLVALRLNKWQLITGDRQSDLKDERRRAQMTAARLVLERSTMMLLTSSKVR